MRVVSYLFVALACGVVSNAAAAADRPKTVVVAGAIKATTATPSTTVAKTTAPTTNPNPAQASAANQAANNAALAVVTKNATGVSGTGMTKPGAGTGSVGGPVKVTGGVVSGNNIQPKHP